MNRYVSVDIETRSRVDIKKAGMYKYAEDPSTELLCVAWQNFPFPPEIWYPDLGVQPTGLITLINDPLTIFTAWNAQFEMENWKSCVARLGVIPDIPVHRWRCTQGDAASCAFPLALGKCAKAMRLPWDQQKDTKGTRLINKLCKPTATGAFRTKKDNLADYQNLYEYCKQDVVTEGAIFRALPQHVSNFEMQVQRHTWESNKRGVPVDMESVSLIQDKIDKYLPSLDLKIQELTNGRLKSPRQRDALLRELSFELKDLRGTTLDKVLAKKENYPKPDIGLLELRKKANNTSLAKFKKILAQLCSDGTIKGNLQYHGAATGRDAARGFQIQNLPRKTEDHPEEAITLLKSCEPEYLDTVLGSFSDFVSGLIRPIIKAPPGKKLIVSDYGQIEARGTAWLVKDAESIREFIKGTDIYKSQAAKMYQIPYEDVSKNQRQYGKLAVLACGYEGGHYALSKFAEGYGLKIARKEAAEVVQRFRASRPQLRAAWKNFGASAMQAIRNPGFTLQVPDVQKAVFEMRGPHLALTLPSDRVLWYPFAQIERKTVRYVDPFTGEKKEFEADNITRETVGLTGNWERKSISGGNLLQNWVQAVCRDIMMEAVTALESANYPVVMRVHDEIGCLTPDSPEWSITDMDEIMCRVPAWCQDFPITSEGYESHRYRK